MQLTETAEDLEKHFVYALQAHSPQDNQTAAADANTASDQHIGRQLTGCIGQATNTAAKDLK
jgi:hypothetical protein